MILYVCVIAEISWSIKDKIKSYNKQHKDKHFEKVMNHSSYTIYDLIVI